MRLSARAILRMPTLMREAQDGFAATGGLHAAALFSLESVALHDSASKSFNGVKTEVALSLTLLREDVGRHNAVDKVIGYALMQGMIPLNRTVMMVSGRLSFEIVQKAAAAGIPVLCAVSAPSSLAVDLAAEVGMTLVGFLREPNFNIYTNPERIVA
jgi:FdhD protein